MIKNRGLLVGMIMAVMLSLTACGSSSVSNDAKMTVENATVTEEMKTESAGMTDNGSSEYVSEEASASQNSTDRKLIRTVSMDVETTEYDDLLAMIEGEVERLGGYIESMDAYNGSRYTVQRASR